MKGPNTTFTFTDEVDLFGSITFTIMCGDGV